MPNGARSSSCIFFSAGSRSMAGGDDVDRAVLEPREAGLHMLLRAERRIDLVVGVERAEQFVGQGEVDRRRRPAVIGTLRSFARRMRSTLTALETFSKCSRPPVASARRISRLVITSSAAGGHSGQAQDQRHPPLVHHAAARQLAGLGMAEDRLVEHQAIFERPPKHSGFWIGPRSRR